MKYRLAPLLVALSLFGCGGGGSSSNGTDPLPTGKGRASIKIQWPNRGRAIPLAANSIRVDLSLNGTLAKTALLVRPSGDAPTTQTTFEDLPVGSLSVSIKALPNADGSGVAQAVGAGTLQINDGQSSSVSVTMDTTIRTLELTPSVTTLGRNENLSVTPTAKDIDGNIVLIAVGDAQERIVWSVDNSSILQLQSQTGGIAQYRSTTYGTTAIHASLTVGESSTPLTASAPITVSGNSGTVIIR